MKLLMIYTDSFRYKTTSKTLELVDDYSEEKNLGDSMVGFIQAEKEDEEKLDKVVTKLIKNLKWAAKKNNTQKIVLHSFAHLSLSKAGPEITKSIFNRAEERLISSGYQVWQTPFGYFLDLDLRAPGKSLARVFKEF